MSRLIVEGETQLQLIQRFTAVSPAAVAVTPEPPAGQRRQPMSIFRRLYNSDNAAHDFRAFLRGALVPGGSVEMTAPALPAPISLLAGATNGLFDPRVAPNLVVPGLRIDYEMFGALGAGPGPIVSVTYLDALQQPLVVPGVIFGVQIALIDDTSPMLVTCPAGVRSRTILANGDQGTTQTLTGALGGSIITNRDTDPGPGDATKTFNFDLVETAQPDTRLFAVAAVAENDQPSWTGLDLLPGQSLRISVAEATITDDPLAYVVFYDNI